MLKYSNKFLNALKYSSTKKKKNNLRKEKICNKVFEVDEKKKTEEKKFKTIPCVKDTIQLLDIELWLQKNKRKKNTTPYSSSWCLSASQTIDGCSFMFAMEKETERI